MKVVGKKVSQEVVFENKNYKGSLKKSPASFRFEQRDLNLELSFTGDCYNAGHYTLTVEGMPIDYLPEAPKRERPTFEIARSEIKTNMIGNNPTMKFPFIVHGKFMYLVVTHNKMTKFTKV